MTRTHTEALRWVEFGSELLLTHVRKLDEAGFDGPSGLPGWTRKHLVAHVAANADALGNLAHWARTGEPTPMYSSMDQRNADIEMGAQRDAAGLEAWLEQSGGELAAGLAALGDHQWQAKVVTAQGRTVSATEIPWLRAREVCVHAVDLGTGVTFTDLPDDFLAALETDIRAKRGDVPDLDGALPDRVGYLAGRTTTGVSSDGYPAPALPAWL